MKKIKFITIKFEILEKLDLTITEYILLSTIGILSKNKGWCWASKETLADIIKIDERQTFRLIKKLINQGLLEKNFEDKRKIRPTTKWYNEFIRDNNNNEKIKKDKKKPYYNNMRVVKKGNKLYCIPNEGGEWLEFAGSKKDIVFK